MSFWSTEKILDEQSKFNLVSDFCRDRLKFGRYYLRLGRDALVTPDGSTDTPPPGEGKYLKIPPGQIAILNTYEAVFIPNTAIGFISVRTPEKIKGLVNISGFHVDPGFKGHLQFSVYNAGSKPIYLDYESDCFLLWFSDLVGPNQISWKTDDSWDKINKFQRANITAVERERMSDGLHSPGALHNRLAKLEDHVNLIIAVGTIIILPLLIGVGITIFDKLFEGTPDKPTILKIVLGSSLITSFFLALVFAGLVLYRSRRKNN